MEQCLYCEAEQALHKVECGFCGRTLVVKVAEPAIFFRHPDEEDPRTDR